MRLKISSYRALGPLALLALLALFAVFWFRTAWLADDALISMRSVLNMAHGYGPVFNVGERVQSYTHTLWFFALAGGHMVTGDIFTAAYALSFVCATAAVALLLWQTRARPAAMFLCFAALVLSKAFMDYTSSGLEVPLTYLLLLACFYTFRRVEAGASGTEIMRPFFLLGLLYLNRPDMILFFVPAALLLLRQSEFKARFLFASGIALLPVLIWTGFSIFYYGIPVPNTALAKLQTGIPVAERLIQGGRYFYNSLATDPITPFCIFLALRFNLTDGRNRPLALGILLNLAYICYVGGDFMQGRFLAPAYLLSVALLSETPLTRTSSLTAAAGILAFGLWNAPATVLSGPDYTVASVSQDGIADERGFYYQNWGLMADNGAPPDIPDWTRTGEARIGGISCGFLGFRGMTSGPGTDWIDSCALTDPVLSRLPAALRGSVRIGHFYRQVPTNYEYAYRGDTDRLQDPEIRELVGLVHSVVRGDPWRWKRLGDIYRLHRFTLSPEAFARQQSGRFPERDITAADLPAYNSLPVNASTLQELRKAGASRFDTGGMNLPERGVELRFDTPRSVRRIRAGLDDEFAYYVFVESDGAWTRYDSTPPADRTGTERVITLAAPVMTSKIRIICAATDEFRSLSYLTLE